MNKADSENHAKISRQFLEDERRHSKIIEQELSETQEKLQQDLARLREEGIKAEINERGTGIKFLTRQEIVQREKEYKERERIIADEQQKRLDLVKTIENTNRSDKENIRARKDLKQSIIDEQK